MKHRAASTRPQTFHRGPLPLGPFSQRTRGGAVMEPGTVTAMSILMVVIVARNLLKQKQI